MKVFKKICVTFIIVLMICISVLFINAYYRYDTLKKEYPVEEIRDNLINKNANYVYHDEIAKDLINATIAVEDQRFNDRYGFDYIAFARAMLTNLICMDFVQGGSTIEQQLIKIYYFDYESSISRKISEIFFMYDLDDAYSKDEIIEMYLNVINYGDGYFGIYEAAHGYFNKQPTDLTLNEASLIAGIPNSPYYLQLSNNNPETYKRQKMILDMMLEQGYINNNQ